MLWEVSDMEFIRGEHSRMLNKLCLWYEKKEYGWILENKEQREMATQLSLDKEAEVKSCWVLQSEHGFDPQETA